MTTFYIVRSHWARGGASTFLRNPDGSGCCLGHIGLQCGFPPSALTYRGLPSTVPSMDHARWPAALEHTGASLAALGNTAYHMADATTVAGVLTAINDVQPGQTVRYWADDQAQSIDIPDEPAREAAIVQVAARADLTLVFVDTAADAPADAQVFGR